LKLTKLNDLSPPASFILKILLVLSLGAVGQFLLAQTEGGLPLVWGLCLYTLAVLFLLQFFPPDPSTKLLSNEPMGAKTEGLFFLFILSIGIFLRAYGANRFPPGIFVDRAEVACGALQILNHHWRPFLEALNLHVPELCIYYMAAGWFKLWGTSPEIFSYFDVSLSTAGIALMYIAFRQVMSPFPALLAFFFLAVMRCNFIFAHQIYFQSETIFFMGLTLAPLFYALRACKPVWAAAAGLALGAGLYSYQSFKAVLLLIIFLMLFEIFREPEKFKKNREVWAVLWIVFVLAALPYLGWVIQNGSLGRREAEVSILARIHEQKSLRPLLENIRDVIRVFNYQMTGPNSAFNFRNHRVLDDVTGVFFVLGFFYALRRAKEKIFFTALAGLGVMSLPGILSAAGDNMGRILGTTPFLACLCAFLLADLRNRWRAAKPSPHWNRTVLTLSFILLAGAAFENYYQYFVVEANLIECVTDCSWTESRAGRWILERPDHTECFLCSLYYGHPTVRYLTYGQESRLHPLDISRPPQAGSFPPGSSFCFLLDSFKIGTLHFLETLYPGGTVETFRDPLGDVTLYTYQVSALNLEKMTEGPLLKKGLEGFYRHSSDEKETPFLKRWDPILNFNFRDLPMTGTPLSIHWTGKFKADKEGIYGFKVILFSTAQGRITVDQIYQQGFTVNPYWKKRLKPGWHRLDLDYQDSGLAATQVHLLWMPPGSNQFELMPNTVFGKTK